MGEADQVPRRAGLFVTLLVVALCGSAVFAWEPWPLSGFRLFSTVRTEQQTSWLATIVDEDGEEVPYPLGSSALGYRGFAFTMNEFAGTEKARRDELCRTWVAAAPALAGREAAEVRIYLRTRALSERVGQSSAPATDELRYVCAAEGLTDAR